MSYNRNVINDKRDMIRFVIRKLNCFFLLAGLRINKDPLLLREGNVLNLRMQEIIKTVQFSTNEKTQKFATLYPHPIAT